MEKISKNLNTISAINEIIKSKYNFIPSNRFELVCKGLQQNIYTTNIVMKSIFDTEYTIDYLLYQHKNDTCTGVIQNVTQDLLPFVIQSINNNKYQCYIWENEYSDVVKSWLKKQEATKFLGLTNERKLKMLG